MIFYMEVEFDFCEGGSYGVRYIIIVFTVVAPWDFFMLEKRPQPQILEVVHSSTRI